MTSKEIRLTENFLEKPIARNTRLVVREEMRDGFPFITVVKQHHSVKTGSWNDGKYSFNGIRLSKGLWQEILKVITSIKSVEK